MDPMRATRDVIGPLLIGLLGMIVLPAATAWGVTRYITAPVDEDFLCESAEFLGPDSQR